MANKYGALKKIPQHPGYWVDPISEIIYWRGTIKGKKFKRSTGAKKITHAKRFVDEFILSLTKDNITRAKRDGAGIVNPSLTSLWNEMIEEREAKLRGRARIHDIRHTFATQTARDNWPTAVACTVLDMSAKEYMKTYVHINDKDMAGWLTGSFE